MRARVLPALVAVAVVGGACSSGDEPGDDVASETASPQATGAPIETRVEVLEERVDRLLADDSGQASLDELGQRVDDLDTLLQDLAGQLDQERAVRSDGDAEAVAALADLEGRVAALESGLAGVRTELQRLREDHEVLERRFENHANHP